MGEVEAAADLEAQLLSLQEEFVRLQEGAAEVEACLGRKVAELEVTLVHLQQLNDQLAADKTDLQVRVLVAPPAGLTQGRVGWWKRSKRYATCRASWSSQWSANHPLPRHPWLH